MGTEIDDLTDPLNAFERGLVHGRKIERLIRERDGALSRVRAQDLDLANARDALREANAAVSTLQEQKAALERELLEVQNGNRPSTVHRNVFEHLVNAYRAQHSGRLAPVFEGREWRHPNTDEHRAAGGSILCALDYLYPNGAPE